MNKHLGTSQECLSASTSTSASTSAQVWLRLIHMACTLCDDGASRLPANLVREMLISHSTCLE